ncbi:MAG: glutamyl-tRNA reductase [Prevotella sp.]|jgi:glutamyl-tRNA reductase|nr:glutamyl-tRNA reductase [Prevotella sp.]
MLHCRLINNSAYTLKERENLSASLYMDESVPHVLLKTCNRIELYWGNGETPEYIIRHLFRVASGLKSELIGEQAIQGQLKMAYQEACGKYRLSASMHRLFQTAMHTGKRIRTETRISKGAISHSQATVDLLKSEGIDLSKKIVGIIGANKLTEDILKYLTTKQAVNIFLSNRNIEKAQLLAKKYNGTAINLEHKKQMLEFIDVLICATSAPHTIIKAADIPKGKEMFIIDLAFPRDVEENVKKNEQIRLFDLETIEIFAKNNVLLRHKEISKAEQIIEEEIADFYRWHSFSQQKPQL